MNRAQREFAELCAVLTVVAALLVCTAIAGCATDPANSWVFYGTTDDIHVLKIPAPAIYCEWNSDGHKIVDNLGGSCPDHIPFNCGDLPRDGSYLLLGCKP